MKIDLDVSTNEVIRELTRYSSRVQNDVIDLMNEKSINIERKAKQASPSNFGRLRSSIVNSQVKDRKRPQVSVVVNANYAPFVEFGTKSNVDIPSGLEAYASKFRTSGGNFDDLLSSIKLWVKRKGIDEEAAYPIALKIAREGVGAQPFLFPAYFKETRDLRKKLIDILAKVR